MARRELIPVPADETKVVRLFWIGQPISVDGLKSVMQASRMNPEHVDIFDVSELGDTLLSTYMVEGLGIDVGQINRAEVDELTGTVAFMRSKAFGGIGQNLQLLPPIRFMGEYFEPGAEIVRPMIKTKSADGIIAGKPAKSGAAMAGRVAMIALAVLFLLVIVMIIVGG